MDFHTTAVEIDRLYWSSIENLVCLGIWVLLQHLGSLQQQLERQRGVTNSTAAETSSDDYGNDVVKLEIEHLVPLASVSPDQLQVLRLISHVFFGSKSILVSSGHICLIFKRCFSCLLSRMEVLADSSAKKVIINMKWLVIQNYQNYYMNFYNKHKHW